MDRCRYPSKPCLNARAVKLNGELHRFCEQHRRQANQNQMRWSKRKQTVLRVRRGDGEDGEDGSDGDDVSDSGPIPPHHHNHHHHHHHGVGGVGPLQPPPPPMGMPHPHGLNVNITAAGASLSHLSLNAHAAHAHNLHAQHHSQPGLISSFQDHMARGGAIPGTNGVNMVLSGGSMRRELAPAPPLAQPQPHPQPQPQPPSHKRANGHVPPIQTALPPLLPPRADQPDPSAVHALLMLERAANVVTSVDDRADDVQDRRELKRAKSNEWVARPTLSPAGLPTMGSLGPPSSSTASSSAAAAVNSVNSVAAIGRSASWQPSAREDPRRESLGQWMQRKQASLPSLSNITRIEKRPYDSISSSAPPASGAFHYRGAENNPDGGGNYNAPHLQHPHSQHPQQPQAQHHRGGPYHVPHHQVATVKTSPGSIKNSSSDPANDGGKRTALV